jgi:cytochrome c peroxidase
VRFFATLGALAIVLAAGNLEAEPQQRLGLPPIAEFPPDSATSEAAHLGRRLFFDKRLSANGAVSCATCHKPDHAFADARPVAIGLEGRTGTRNTPSVLNAALHTTQFWDGRRTTLEAQAREPFVNPVEHGLENHDALLGIVRRDDLYVRGFRVTADEVQLHHVAGALASFIRSLATGDSAFDRYAFGNDPSALSPAAGRGLVLFRGRAQCAVCHTIGERHAGFTDNQFHSVGVGMERIAPKLAALATRVARAEKEAIGDLVIADPDVAALGRFAVTRDPADIGKFRTPSLRNVALTAPYMHDGSIASLEAAVDHELYYRGQSLGRPLILTPAERSDLVAFLRSLTSSKLPR